MVRSNCDMPDGKEARPFWLSFLSLAEYNGEMMTPALENLLERVSSAARNIPGAAELYLFGSAADPARKDAYSDLDLQVISADYALSRAAWPWALQEAGVMALAYPLGEQAQESAFCIAFEHESPYHKVDIGLSAAQNRAALIQGVENKVLLWRQTAKGEPAVVSSGAAYMGEAYMPAAGSAAHFLAGELLGAVRYAKARKRGQQLTCWRFASAKVNALLRCAVWNGDPKDFPQNALNTWDFVALDRAMPEVERTALLEGLRLGSAREMDGTLLEITRKIAARIEPGYRTGESQLARMVREYLGFMERELGSHDHAVS